MADFVQAYIHAHCGGVVKGRKCLRCGKKWNIISFWVDPSGIRPQIMNREEYEKKSGAKVTVKKGATYAKWADKLPGVSTVASRLPNWPRWARLLTAGLLVAGLLVVIILLPRWL